MSDANFYRMFGKRAFIPVHISIMALFSAKTFSVFGYSMFSHLYVFPLCQCAILLMIHKDFAGRTLAGLKAGKPSISNSPLSGHPQRVFFTGARCSTQARSAKEQ